MSFKNAARWIQAKWNCDTYAWSKTTDTCLQEFRWPSLANRLDHLCIAFLFDLIHQRYTLSFNSYCSFKTITYLRSHSLSLQTVNSSINAYRYTYFVKIPFYETLSQLVWVTVYCQAIPPICMFFFHLANFYILLILFVVIWYNL